MIEFPPPSGSPSSFDSDPFTAVSRDDGPYEGPAPQAPDRRGLVWRSLLVGGLAGAILGGGVAFVTVEATEDDSVAAPAAIAQQNVASAADDTGAPSSAPPPVGAGAVNPAGAFDIQAVLAKVSPSVVSIETGVAGSNGIFPNGAGSGVVISADGLVLTNNHVIQGADKITVKTSDGKEYKSDVVGAEPSRDIALVRMESASGLSPATLADTAKLKVGDTVIAIGNALDLGDSPTVTVGIVSAKSRTIRTPTEALRDLIQTDAAINPGNSGGALVNTSGEVVGINTAGIQDAQNISFAIDINGVKPLIDQLKAGKATVSAQAFLGIGTVPVEQLSDADRSQLGVQASAGAVVTDVQPESGAAAAGIKVGDVITSIDGRAIGTSDDIRSALDAKQPNDQVQVTVDRQGHQVTLTATLGSRAVPSG